MEELKDSKVTITVDGKNVHNGEPLFVEVTDDKITLLTKIGKTQIQDLKIVVERGVYVNEEKEE